MNDSNQAVMLPRTPHTPERHTFLVAAYKTSPYLEACLKSLRAQTVQSRIVISTSTPFDGLQDIAKRFDAEYFIHSPHQGIANDWNQGLTQIDSGWITIAHQDDIYLPQFTEKVLNAIQGFKDPVLIFTGYAEIVADTIRTYSLLLWIKRVLLNLGFLGRPSISSIFAKSNCLRFGCPIPCPAVTFRSGERSVRFDQAYKVDLDWAAWLSKAQGPGQFLWIREVLMQHRIHAESETSSGISEGYRAAEDYKLLRRLWPKPIAWIIAKSYAIAYSSNKG
ncbi:MAG TPA: glycosyl transferase family 2 [Hydrogenophaga sp.]|uniref:glycosyltransferase family 2 protein n=1 Tax=Hydrogenophaga sp. TaxID=1904254 RepID=UPI000E95AA0F|nr:glycosyltransferase [Hydrogenophaga sp.]HAX22376.1 glycosyl transferase family 2 [Hydrogenophaga sp.]HBU20383.1 glycosyl transferase family 2 [Hydrogenophaga sp.]